KWIEKYFGGIPGGNREIPRPEPVNKLLGGEMVDTVYDNIQLPAVFLAYRMPPQGTKDAYALEMLTTLLSSGQSSRLYRSMVDEKQIGLTVQAFLFAMENGVLFITFGLSNMGVDLEDFRETMDEDIGKVRSELISEKEYKKLQHQMES